MTAPIPPHLQVPQLRVRSITAGLKPDLSDQDGELLKIDDGRSGVRSDVIVTICRFNANDLGAEPRLMQISVRALLALARLENDYPARAPVAATSVHVPPNARGKTFDPAKDEVRLGRALQAVLDLMQDGVWRTLFEIRNAVYHRCNVTSTEAGISARLRDLRKPQYGGHTLESERIPETSGLWRYRIRVAR